MVGRGSVAALAVALALGVGAAQASAQDGLRLQKVYADDPAMINALETQGYDVGYVGERTEAAVYLDDHSEALLRAQGYRIGEVVANEDDFLARRAEINATTAAEARAAEVAKNGLSQSAKAKGAVNVPGQVVIQRAYTFSNYAGRFLYVEAKNHLHDNDV